MFLAPKNKIILQIVKITNYNLSYYLIAGLPKKLFDHNTSSKVPNIITSNETAVPRKSGLT